MLHRSTNLTPRSLIFLSISSSSRSNGMSNPRRVGWSQLSDPLYTPGQGSRSERVPAREVVPRGGSRSSPPRRLDLGDGKPRVSPEKVGGGTRSPDGSLDNCAFDLCPVRDSTPVFRLKRSLLEENRERRIRADSGPRHVVPRPGMVLLKNYICHRDQVTLVLECQKLGRGPGGFYQPGYRDGAKLHLQMMCLGKNWDPETKKYHDIRSYDDARPPLIPEPFKKMVENAMKTSHDLIRRSYEGRAEYDLPKFSPDLCIVNFYSNTGKLGVHQDQDESKESLCKGLPVVSFSVGDSADFLYGDSREATNTIKLESGDVLIFGGKSRDIFHGVSKIYPQSAPKNLIEETNLRPGRLNLTFRQY